MNESEIDARMRRDGFPELTLLWDGFRRRRAQLAELDEDTIRRRRNRHMAARWWPPAVGIVAGAASVWWSPLHAPGVAFLVFYACVCLHRYVASPFGRILEDDLALMLSRQDYRSWLDRQPRARAVHERLEELGVNATWDDPAYRAPQLPDHHDFVQTILRDVLGEKRDRRFRPGRFIDSLRDGKASVTRFVAKHQEDLNANRERTLDADRGAPLLRALLEEIESDSPGHKHVSDAIHAVEDGHYLMGKDVRAEVWRRDPWVDLTHQEEFYSSASLRGVKWIGRGPKGRLGPFGYLRNPAISALDFRTRAGRAVRARVAAAVADGEAVLFVDGVEGSNAVPPAAILAGLRAYAEAAGFASLVCNANAHNVVPRRFIRHVDAEHREVRLRYVDDADREYLDAFAPPLEPFEYSFPRGTVIGPVLGKSIGHPLRRRTRAIAWMRMNMLWLVIAPLLVSALFILWRESTALFAGLAVFILVGLCAHWTFQRRSISGRTRT